MMTRALGIDVSRHNGPFNFDKAKLAGVDFVFCKASQFVEDETFKTNWQKAKDAGLLRGAYHYLDYHISELDQAKLFVSLIKFDPGELPPVIDFEQRYVGMPPAPIVCGKLWNILQYVERETGKIPMIYSGFYYWQEFCNSNPGWLKYQFWLAWYAPEWYVKWRSGGTGAPPPWTNWKFWQWKVGGDGPKYGSTGLNIDMDRFNGTADELKAFASVPLPAPLPVPPGLPPVASGALGAHKVTAARLNVFTGPGSTYKQSSVSPLRKDAVVNVLDFVTAQGEQWGKIEAPPGCYVRAIWLKKIT